MKIAAGYARYSNKRHQKGKSIDDQIAQFHETARRHDRAVPDELIFKDAGISGTGMLDRPGIQALMEAAKQRKFDTLIVESTSRLSRNRAHAAQFQALMKFCEITIIDQNGVVTDLVAAINAIVDSEFIKNLVTAVKRGQSGLVNSGLVPGSVTYGHRRVLETLPDGRVDYAPGKREIDEDEARVVYRMFDGYANGASTREMAAEFTNDGIVSPSGGKVWNHQKMMQMLQNPIYIGKLHWNRTRFVTNPETETRLSRKGRPEDLKVVDVPHLAFIPQDLWDRVQAVRTERSVAKFGEGGLRRTHKFGGVKNHLLHGRLVCEHCGSHMIVGQANTDGSRRVVCSAAHRLGTCKHRKSYCLAELQSTVLQCLDEMTTDPDVLRGYVRGFQKIWAARQKDIGADREVLQQKISKLTVQIDRYVAAIGETEKATLIKALMAKIDPLETERAGLEAQMKALSRTGGASITTLPSVMDKYCLDMKRTVGALIGRDEIKPEELPPFERAFRTAIDSVTVHETAKRARYEVSVNLLEAPIIGADVLFPSTRDMKEMLAAQGVSATKIPATSGNCSCHNRNTISLGRFRQSRAA